MKNLKPRGTNLYAAFPTEIRICRAGDFEPYNDQMPEDIYGIYEDDGKYYCSMVKPMSANDSAIAMCFADTNDDSLPGTELIKTGLFPGEEAIWGAWIDGKMHVVEWDIYYVEKSGDYILPRAKGKVTDEVIEVHNNQYFAMELLWPDERPPIETPASYEPGKPKTSYRVRKFAPKYSEGYSFSIVKGHGEITKSSYDPRYIFAEADLYEGEVVVGVKAIPMPDATGENAYKEYSITFPPKQQEIPDAETQAEWATMVAYGMTFNADKDGLTITPKPKEFGLDMVSPYKVAFDFWFRTKKLTAEFECSDGKEFHVNWPPELVEAVAYYDRIGAAFHVNAIFTELDDGFVHKRQIQVLEKAPPAFEYAENLTPDSETETREGLKFAMYDAKVAIQNVTGNDIPLMVLINGSDRVSGISLKDKQWIILAKMKYDGLRFIYKIGSDVFRG